jgi:type IV pilus assembly protein PilA
MTASILQTSNENKSVFLSSRKKQSGFTLIELVVVLLVMGVLAYFTIPQIQAFQSSSKVDASIEQIRSLVSSAQRYGKRNGDKTGISMQALVDRGLIPPDWADGTGINPWAGDVTIEVDTDLTKVIIKFKGIDDDAAGLRFEDELNNGMAISATYASGTLEALFEVG